MTLVKICGLKDPATAIATAEAGADFIGFVFAAKSSRRVTAQEARVMVDAVRAALPCGDAPELASLGPYGGFDNLRRCGAAIASVVTRRRPLFVGVFANQDMDEVNAIAEEASLDLIQLHGSETNSDAARACRPVVRASHILPDTPADELPNQVKALTAAAVLFDTKVAGGALGGTGLTFDWNIARPLTRSPTAIPFFLAGGLSVDNVGDAVCMLRPWAVDVSSSLETDGVKDITKIRSFINNVRGADQSAS